MRIGSGEKKKERKEKKEIKKQKRDRTVGEERINDKG